MKQVAVVQMCSSSHLAENLAYAKSAITAAANQGAELVVLPEMFSLLATQRSDYLKYGEPYGVGTTQSFLAELASTLKIWLVAGTLPILSETSSKVRSACLIYNSHGEIVGRYDKMHLFDASFSDTEHYRESDTFEAGDSICVIDSPFGKLGLAICYDIRFPEMFRMLINRGAEIIIIPTAFTKTTGKAHWEILTRCRAIENTCYIVAACQGGHHANGRETFGDSMIVAPWGNIIARIEGAQVGIAVAPIDLLHLQEIRRNLPSIQHQRFQVIKK